MTNSILTTDEISSLPAELQDEFLHLLDEHKDYYHYNKLKTMFLDFGPYSRDKYQKHLAFFKAGAKYHERGAFGANRSGKSTAAYCEVSWHVTGEYEDWWEGATFDHPVTVWVCSKTIQSTREVCQEQHLLGPVHDIGSGYIPKDRIAKIKYGAGNSGGFIEEVLVRWRQTCECKFKEICAICQQKMSKIGFKTYVQGHETYMGVHRDIIVLDEEPIEDEKIYNECLFRTDPSETGEEGHMIVVFTPLNGGRTSMVKSYLPKNTFPNRGWGGEVEGTAGAKYVIQFTWDDVPHLSEEWKARALADTPDHLKDARSKGQPGMGAGSIFTVPKSLIEIEDFKIPSYWPRAFGFDPGPNKNAIVWAACDPNTDVIYIYRAELYGAIQPRELAGIIKAGGNIWIPGIIDNYSMGNSPTDQNRLFNLYAAEGLDIRTCKKTPEADISYMTSKFKDGTLRVFSSCELWWQGYFTYSRDERFQIIKEDDDIMDASRYLIRDFYSVAKTKPVHRRTSYNNPIKQVNPYTGY